MVAQMHDFEGRGKKFINPRAVMAVRDHSSVSGNCLVNLFGGAEISLTNTSAKEVAEKINAMAAEDDE